MNRREFVYGVAAAGDTVGSFARAACRTFLSERGKVPQRDVRLVSGL